MGTAPLRLVRSAGRDTGSSDADLMRALHDEHAGALRGYVMGLTGGDHARAQDVVQETLLRAWRKPAVLDQSAGSARNWLFTVARRIIIDEWRSSRSKREVVTGQAPEVAVPDGSDDTLNRTLVVDALRRLSDEHRQVLLECYLRDATVAEAAIRLGVPPGTVKSRTHYALRAFKIAIAELEAAQ